MLRLKKQIYVLVFVYLSLENRIYANLIKSSYSFEEGFCPLFHADNEPEAFLVKEKEKVEILERFCNQMNQSFQKFGWKDLICRPKNWQVDLKSKNGWPLIYQSWGQGENTTLFLGGVHPDELTPIYLSFRLANYFDEHTELHQNQKAKIIIAPLVAPDGFLTTRPIRTNGEVDVNRNFFTYDWYDKALTSWEKKKTSTRNRYFPGYFPNTEIEIKFQEWLLKQYTPDKIFSIHAPLGFLDYDGPGDGSAKDLSEIESRAKNFVYKISESSNSYRVVDYSFYPGSLGNLGGYEKRIPTITLELETANPKKGDEYWRKFLPGFLESVKFPYSRKQVEVSRLVKEERVKG